MKSLFTGYFKDPLEEEEKAASTSIDPANISDASALSLQNMRRNMGNAWNSIAYGKWRRKDTVLEDSKLQVWLLGRFYVPESHGSSIEEDCPMFFNDYSSRIWLTYRRDFSPLGGTQKTTDCGWGCMLRSAQMMIAQALTVLHLGRAYRLTDKTNEVLKSIIKLFEDVPDSELGIHKLISLIGDDAVGQWFSPSRAMASLRDAISQSTNDLLKDVRVYLTVDNCVFLNEVEELSENWEKAIIIVVCVRLGTKKINECYINHVKSIFSFESSLGAIGGRPKHSVYFVGFHGKTLFDLDPHVAQKYNSLESDDEKIWKSFHCRKPTRMKIDEMDPSCALGFLIRTEQEFKTLLKQLAESGIIECGENTGVNHRRFHNSSSPLFSIMVERILSSFMIDDEKSSAESSEEDLHGFEVV